MSRHLLILYVFFVLLWGNYWLPGDNRQYKSSNNYFLLTGDTSAGKKSVQEIPFLDNQPSDPNIYTGGSEDGHSQSSATNQNPLPSIYAGGSEDGHSQSSATNQNPLPAIYAGGSEDGNSQSSAVNQNPLPVIYVGGNEDGHSQSSAVNQNPLPAIYVGGNEDGHSRSSAANQNPLPAIYVGGNEDGHSQSSAANQNPLPAIYVGGNEDGHSQSSAANQNPLPGIYVGGNEDGHSQSTATNQNPLPNIYTGGNEDGHSQSSATNQNPLPNIYTGGNEDGHSQSSATNHNPLPAIYVGGNDDGHSQSSATNQNPAPVVITCPDNVIIQCISDLPCPATVTEFLTLQGASVSGFCSSNLSIGCVTVLNDGNECSGTYTRTYTVSDDCGNTATCSQTITVIDNTAPVVNTQNITVYLNAAGMVTITPDQVNNNSADNCGSILLSLNKTTFTCADVGPNTVVLTATDACGNSASSNATITVIDNIAPQALCRNIAVNLGVSGSVTITAADIDNGSSDACGILNKTLSQYTFTNAGTYTVTLTVTDVNNNTATCNAIVSVNLRPTVIIYTGENEEQYSDHTSLSAELRDQLTNTVLAGKQINFVIGSKNTTANTNASGIASATMHIYQNVGDYDVTSNFAGDAIYASSTATEDYDILKENATAEYTGPEFVSVPCATCPTTTILLSALVKDTSSGTPPGDAYPGDIRKARVNFVDLNTLVNLSGWLSPGLLNPSDSLRGVVTYLWTVPLPNTGYDTYSIGIVVDCDNNGTGNYIGYAQTVINVSRSSLTEFITGGGHVIPGNSGGSYSSDAGRKVNFGFNIKWNKSLKNLQGKANIIFRRGARVYQIKSTSATSLSINSTDPCSKKATFIGKANLQDVTDPNIPPVSVLGNLNLQINIVDNGEPGTNNDRIAISLFNGNTLIYSTHIPYNNTLPLAGGNIVVHNGVECPNTTKLNNSITTKNPVFESKTEESGFMVKIWPNPTENNFTLTVISDNNKPVEVTLLDVSGKLMQNMKGTSGSLFSFGFTWKAGTYFAVVRQGKEKKTIKLVKQ